MNSPKNILVLTPGFPASEDDTSCIPALQTLIRAMHRQYGGTINLHVIAYQYPFESGEYKWYEIPCYSAGGKNAAFPARWKTWLRAIRQARKIHRQSRIDIVHSFWLNECTLTGSWISQITGAKHIAHVMGRDVLPANKYIRYFSRTGMKIIANSPFTEKMLFDSFGINADCVIPFGLDPVDFTGVENGSNRQVDILGAGSLTKIKNFELFVKMFSQLANDFPHLKGAIIGDGPEREMLQQQIIKANLHGKLTLMGSMSRSQVLRIMSNSRILLHTAPFESAAYVFLEALYSGMQVVAFKTGFLPFVPEAVPCDNEAMMLKALHELISRKITPRRVEVPLISETSDAVMQLYLQ